jgi:hypothetical protein
MAHLFLYLLEKVSPVLKNTFALSQWWPLSTYLAVVITQSAMGVASDEHI